MFSRFHVIMVPKRIMQSLTSECNNSIVKTRCSMWEEIGWTNKFYPSITSFPISDVAVFVATPFTFLLIKKKTDQWRKWIILSQHFIPLPLFGGSYYVFSSSEKWNKIHKIKKGTDLCLSIQFINRHTWLLRLWHLLFFCKQETPMHIYVEKHNWRGQIVKLPSRLYSFIYCFYGS